MAWVKGESNLSAFTWLTNVSEGAKAVISEVKSAVGYDKPLTIQTAVDERVDYTAAKAADDAQRAAVAAQEKADLAAIIQAKAAVARDAAVATARRVSEATSAGIQQAGQLVSRGSEAVVRVPAWTWAALLGGVGLIFVLRSRR